MPRIARPAGADMLRLRAELQRYLQREGSTPTAFARSVGVNQSTVQRFLAGNTKSATPQMRKALGYAGIALEARIETPVLAAADHPRVRLALESVWDGRPQTAEILASMIEAIGPFIQQTFPAQAGAGTGEQT